MTRAAHELPTSLGSPAIRALTGAGFTRLAELSTATESEILALHGMGPKAVARLRDLMAAEGVTFTDGKEDA